MDDQKAEGVEERVKGDIRQVQKWYIGTGTAGVTGRWSVCARERMREQVRGQEC